jgi:glycosyltransferase involved in cell wall biosynthesis
MFGSRLRVATDRVPMRVTFILPAYPWKPNGGFRTVYEHANQLVARGHQVLVVHSRRLANWPPPPTTKIYRGLRWKTRRLGEAVRDWLFRPRVDWQPIDPRVEMRYVPEPRPEFVPDSDAVFATYWPTAEYAVGYPEAKGKKFYLIQDFEFYFGPKDRLLDTWKMSFHRVTISKWLYDQVSQITTDGRTAWVPEGIDHRRFRVLRDLRSRPRCIAMCFSTAPYKAAWDAVRAVERCRSHHADVRVIAFGTGPRPDGLPSWIEYMRNLPEPQLVDIYNSARIFVCSSLAEGFALPPAEAMACGCAVVMTDCGGNRDYAEDGVTALLSPPGDPDALARNVLRLLEDETLQSRLTRAGQERIQEFTWDRSTDLLERFILESISG